MSSNSPQPGVSEPQVRVGAQNPRDYDRIARVLAYLEEQAPQQPSLDDLAALVTLSPHHFQRLFTRWAGVSPKRYLQVLTVERAKDLLAASKPVLEVAWSVGLSGGSRLHDHFVQIEAMTPGTWRHGEGLVLSHGVLETPYGPAWAALSPRGLCRLEFLDDEDAGAVLEATRRRWPAAVFQEDRARVGERVGPWLSPGALHAGQRPSLYVGGTSFQVQVWKALLRVPPGALASYAQIAQAVGRPRAARAVGQAVGDNPVAMLIPCHRVIQGSGLLGGYRWGTTRKLALNLREQCQAEAASPA